MSAGLPGWACRTLRIRMLGTVTATFPLNILKPGTALEAGREYRAAANRNGAVSGLCGNGEWLGVKPGEFEVVGEDGAAAEARAAGDSCG